ncbi:MAG: RNA-splicing ligase RtcB [candidate division BRC1 bacterium ADurb.BinA364]|nr:MAG: RNA-splicing ligase RtcB [candidate division BRC1 bacterium ADurb.BinA364]
MKARELAQLGLPPGPARKAAIRACANAAKDGMHKNELRSTLRAAIEQPALYREHRHFGALAAMLIREDKEIGGFIPRDGSAPWKRWGRDLDAEAIRQIENACKLPVSVAGALMPDAHVGYGLPIGGVLAVQNAVIPYAVGVDIACRMKMTVLDLPETALYGQKERLINALNGETRFGIGAKFRQAERREHAVMDADWSFSPLVKGLKDRAWEQLGTSGSGNHFVEFGSLTFDRDDLGLKAGKYLALLSHSGSRGSGAQIAGHFSKLAMKLRSDLPRELRHLAWLDLDSEEGRQYWQAMQLMGRYAAANHELIHRAIARALHAEVLLDVENHHNFAWKETHLGRETIVHRKGATPAGAGVLGIIPGSMGDPGFLARGKGSFDSLHSASHGAGRRMSRKQAMNSFTWNQVKHVLAERGITLLSAGLDEAPMAYKDICEVMAEQQDLVEAVARFDPKIVKMAPAGERPED